MLSRVERWRRQDIVAAHLLIVHHYPVAHLPDEIIRGQHAKPCFQHIPDAEAFILSAQHPPCALQLKPELHIAFLPISYLHFVNDSHDNDINDNLPEFSYTFPDLPE